MGIGINGWVKFQRHIKRVAGTMNRKARWDIRQGPAQRDASPRKIGIEIVGIRRKMNGKRCEFKIIHFDFKVTQLVYNFGNIGSIR